MKWKTNEHCEQAAVIEWRNWHLTSCPELALLHAIPNGAATPCHRSQGKGYVSPLRIKLLKEGLLPGVCDLFLPVARQGFHGLYIEMKIHPNKLTKEQEWFIYRVRREGYRAEVCWSAEQAIKLLTEYLGIPPDIL